MKKLFMMVGIVLSFTVCAWAQEGSVVADEMAVEMKGSGSMVAEDASGVAEDMAAEMKGSGSVVAKDGLDVDEAVKSLVESGVPADEAKSIVAQAVKDAQKEGLKGKDLSAKVHEAVKAAKAAKAADHPKGSGTEHPKGSGTEHPKGSGTEHPKGSGSEHPKAGSQKSPEEKMHEIMKSNKSPEHPSKAKPKDHPGH